MTRVRPLHCPACERTTSNVQGRLGVRTGERATGSAHTAGMGVHLIRALALVLHDLEETGGPVPVVEVSDWQTHPGAESAFLRSVDQTGMGVWVDTGAPLAEQVVMVADQVQEWAVEERAMRRATNWPRCPEHPENHPLTAVATDETAVWTCPASGRAVCGIGQLEVQR